ncbi:MAG: SMP-30/gluconolactonase/LRE family protein [Spirochaetales bacterium]|nr:MAG: SMP-30/gluconolactonase/LRE family protein [Spirochaetales bacterium]
MKYNIEHIYASQSEIGEAPLWVPEEESLYWTDTQSNSIWRMRLTDGAVIRWRVSLPVTALMRREGDGFLLVTKTGLAFWESRTNVCELIANPLAGRTHLSFNDGVIDRQGRLITGTMNHVKLSPPDGCLYRLDGNLTLNLLDSGLSVANGIGVSPDGKTVYLSEQFKGRILTYDYDTESGILGNRRVFAKLPEAEGLPDGITVDAEGFVWNCHWGGSLITRYTPAGKKDLQITMPVPIIACLAFAGDGLSDLYVTTGWYGMNSKDRKKKSGAGDLFRIKTGFKGLREPRFKG